MDALDAIEQALVQLTTAELEGMRPATGIFKTVIPAQAGTHAECDVPTESEGAETQRGDGSRRSPG